MPIGQGVEELHRIPFAVTELPTLVGTRTDLDGVCAPALTRATFLRLRRCTVAGTEHELPSKQSTFTGLVASLRTEGLREPPKLAIPLKFRIFYGKFCEPKH